MNGIKLRNLKALVHDYNSLVYGYDGDEENKALALLRSEINNRTNELGLQWEYDEYPMITIEEVRIMERMEELAVNYNVASEIYGCLDAIEPEDAVYAMIECYNGLAAQEKYFTPEGQVRLVNTYKCIKACAELAGVCVGTVAGRIYLFKYMD